MRSSGSSPNTRIRRPRLSCGRTARLTDAKRIGILGGTFDPPHIGHVSVAKDVADALDLDRVLWIPAGCPPHKDPADLTPAAIRLEMARAAAAHDRRFCVDSIEIEREGPSYTVDTVRSLSRAHPRAELFVIMGADQFRTFEEWRQPSEILRHATVVVMDRAGRGPNRAPEGVVHVPVRRVDVSSTGIRRSVRDGADVRALVPEGVFEIIEREGLYGA